MPFFELDDPELDLGPPVSKPERGPAVIQRSEADTRPMGRKVQPFEIPAGHVDLSGVNRFPGPVDDFSIDHPERFVGRTVKGRYVISEYLGGDVTGFAYIGEDRLLDGRKVLVRILIEEDFDEIMASVLGEERVSLSHFTHPNVARLIDSGEFANGVTFLVSEYVDALSVSDILTIHSKFDLQRTGRLIRQAANALNEAHQEGIIHRDIRPENIIIDPTAEPELVKIVNFGASNGEPNRQNLVYKSPEVLEGRIATVSSDIFSLGVVAFEMLTGQMPFRGQDIRELLRSQNLGLTQTASQLDPLIPRAVDEVFERSLAFDHADRFSKARDLGEALQTALAVPLPQLVSIPAEPLPTSSEQPRNASTIRKGEVIDLAPIVPIPMPGIESSTAVAAAQSEPSWKSRSPEPPEVGPRSGQWPIYASLAGLAVVIAAIWYFAPGAQVGVPPNSAANQAAASPSGDMPPLPRTIIQPANTLFYQNSKQDLRGDLLRNFVGFTLYYPKDWKVNGPQAGGSGSARGKFLDISQATPDGRLKEQMLISYYTSKGTFDQDLESFPLLVKETNETLKTILPDYQVISEGEIKVNQSWRGYEVKFQAGGQSDTGEKLVVWGRRIFIPAARAGARNGFEVTMLATSLSDSVRSVDDVGVKGELASILDSFEPSQNF